MAKRQFPNLGLTGGYADGDDGWGDEQNLNLLKLSTVVQGGVLGRVAAVPAAPAQGDVYILTAAPNAQAVAAYDNGGWVYFAPAEGWLFYDRGTDNYVSFDGAAWQDLATGGGGGGLADAPQDGKIYARKDGGWVEVTSGGGGSSAPIPVAAFTSVTNGLVFLEEADGMPGLHLTSPTQANNTGATATRAFDKTKALSVVAFVQNGNVSKYGGIGLVMKDSTNNTGATIQQTGGYGVEQSLLAAGDALNGSWGGNANDGSRPMWLRLDWNPATGTITAYRSYDSFLWLQQGTTQAVVAPDRVGIFIRRSDNEGSNRGGVVTAYNDGTVRWNRLRVDGSGGGGGSAATPYAFRYMRLNAPEFYADGASASTIAFYYKGVKLANPAILSDNASGSYPFSAAFDNDPATFFSTYGVGANWRVVLDFGAQVQCDEIRWTNRQDTAQQAPATLEIWTSTDNKDYYYQRTYYPLTDWSNPLTAVSRRILPQGGGGGSGGGSTSGPTIIQTAAFRKGGALTLPNAPTPGNYIVLVWAGFPNNQQQPPGFSKVDQVQSNGNNGVAIYIRRYIAGDPTVWNVGVTSDSGWAIYEVSKLKNITRNSSTVGALGLNGNAFSVPIPLVGDGIYLFAFEQDNAPNFVLDAKAGQVVDAVLTAASGENHSGLVGHLTSDWVSPAITGTLDQPLAPVFGAWNLT